ncbi:MAG TPA: RNA polymerase subunit sigma-70 [Acidimicrobiaceae bacterium]|nr:RNA polymerase subunit sigma-70 [Acidimicrobiaceae bacterium]
MSAVGTLCEESLVQRYLHEIGRHPLLPAHEEIDLARLVRAGDEAQARLEQDEDLSEAERAGLRHAAGVGEEAAERFVNANLRLVVAMAKRYQWSRLSLLDLVQEGNLGLLQAVHAFDGSMGFRFSTYATWCIRQAISRGIDKAARPIRLPSGVAQQVKLLRQEKDALHRRLARPPTAKELGEALGWTTAAVQALEALPGQPTSLDAPVSDEDEGGLASRLADVDAPDPADAVVRDQLSARVRQLLGRLPERERRLVGLRYGLSGDRPRTLDEAGRMLGISRARVRQVEARAIQALQHSLAEAGLAELLAS